MRLRRAAGRAILTYKGPARFQDGVKTREEREIEVSDPAEAEGILAGLGLERRFRYEKRREEWDFDGCVVALDETPIGTFVEVEGDPRRSAGSSSGSRSTSREAIPYSYAELYRGGARTSPPCRRTWSGTGVRPRTATDGRESATP